MMIRSILLGVAVLVAASLLAPIHAGTVTITVLGTECTGANCQAVFTVPNAQVTRFINSYAAALGQVKVDPACVTDVATPPIPCAMRARTAAETVKGWAKGILQGTLNNVVSGERQGVSKTAVDAIPDAVAPDPN